MFRGFRHGWLLVVGFAVIGALAGLGTGLRTSTAYEAESVVVASSTSIPVDDFPSVARAVFATDTVIQLAYGG